MTDMTMDAREAGRIEEEPENESKAEINNNSFDFSKEQKSEMENIRQECISGFGGFEELFLAQPHAMLSDEKDQQGKLDQMLLESSPSPARKESISSPDPVKK